MAKDFMAKMDMLFDHILIALIGFRLLNVMNIYVHGICQPRNHVSQKRKLCPGRV